MTTRRWRTPSPMMLVWVTLVRGLMAITLGLALTLHHSRTRSAGQLHGAGVLVSH